MAWLEKIDWQTVRRTLRLVLAALVALRVIVPESVETIGLQADAVIAALVGIVEIVRPWRTPQGQPPEPPPDQGA